MLLVGDFLVGNLIGEQHVVDSYKKLIVLHRVECYQSLFRRITTWLGLQVSYNVVGVFYLPTNYPALSIDGHH
jgi:hypothetical protein